MLTNQTNMLKIAKLIAAKTDDSSFDLLAIKDVLKCLQNQRSKYSNFEYLGHGGFSLILKTSLGKDQRALKIVKCQKHIEKETAKKEYEFLKLVGSSSYFSIVYDCFFLFEEEDEDDEEEKDQNSKCKYLVIDMELCKCNLSEKFDEMRKAKVQLNDTQKGILAVQMLDSLNMLHKKEILHRDIKPQNILVSLENQESIKDNDTLFTVKLSDLGLASQLKSEQSKSFLSGKNGINSYMSIEASEGKQQKKSDLFSMGLVLLEMDNYLTFRYSTITNLEFSLLQREGISALDKHKINKQSPLYEIIKVSLNPDYKKRASASQILEYLLSQQQYAKVEVFSLITEAALFSDKPLSIVKPNNKNLEYSQILLSQLSNAAAMKTKEGATSTQQFQESILQSQIFLSKNVIENINEIGNKSFLSPDEIKSALKVLYKQKKFMSFSLLGRGSAGIVFSVRNIVHQRNSVIKLCSGKDRVSILREVSVMQKCHSPYIVKFFGYEFFSDEKKNKYVWMEFERCICTLSHFLDLHREDLSNEQKLQFAYQIIDSVNTLHCVGVLHGDIKLDNFLISLDSKGNQIIKLSDFDQSAILTRKYEGYGNLMNEFETLFLRGKGGTVAFNSPEKNLSKDNPSTLYSDCFSVGLCLLLLDNYATFENKFYQSCFYLLQPYKTPFSNCLNLLNQTSKLYQWSQLLLKYYPDQRYLLSNIVCENKNNSIILYSKIHQDLLQINQVDSLIIERVNYSEIVEYLNSHSSILQKSLKSFTLILEKSSIESEGIEQLSNGLSKLISLSSLTLDLRSNKIKSEVVQQLSNGLSKLTLLSSLTLNLSDNNVQSEGVQYLSNGLSRLISLSSLALELKNNNIQSEGIQELSNCLSKLISVSSLALNLSNNNLQSQGVNQLSIYLSQLISISSLTLNLSSNNIQSEGMLIFSMSLSSLIQLSSLTLDLRMNNIQSAGVKQLSNGLSKLISLSQLTLDLRINNTQSEGIYGLSNGLSKLISLQSLTLDLFGNQMESEGVFYLSNCLSKLVSLSSLTLNLSYNNIGIDGMQYLSNGLSKLIYLLSLTLNLFGNNIEGEGMQQLSNGLSQLVQLSQLQLILNCNQISNEGMQQFSNHLSKLTQLSSLSLSFFNNYLENEGMQQLSNGLSKLIQLSLLSLHLGGNEIQSEGVQQLSNGLSKLIQLSSLQLKLDGNNIKSEGVKQLSNGLSKLISLSSLTLDLRSNNISSEGMQQFSNGLSKLIQLSSLTLDLSDNNIQSEGVKQLSQGFSKLILLSSLTIHLSENNIQGQEIQQLSNGLSKLISLQSLILNLSGNKIESEEKEKLKHLMKEMNVHSVNIQ